MDANRTQDATAWIETLPVELLLFIFRLTLSDWMGATPYYGNYYWTLNRLCGVSNRWCQVILNTPDLWAVLYEDQGLRTLPLANGCPLIVETEPSEGAVFDLLMPSTLRISTLILRRGRGVWSGRIRPGLRYLAFSSTTTLFSATLDILSMCPNLEVFSLDDTKFCDVEARSVPVRLRALQECQVILTTDEQSLALVPLLNSIVAPSCTKLQLQSPWPWDWEDDRSPSNPCQNIYKTFPATLSDDSILSATLSQTEIGVTSEYTGSADRPHNLSVEFFDFDMDTDQQEQLEAIGWLVGGRKVKLQVDAPVPWSQLEESLVYGLGDIISIELQIPSPDFFAWMAKPSQTGWLFPNLEEIQINDGLSKFELSCLHALVQARNTGRLLGNSTISQDIQPCKPVKSIKYRVESDADPEAGELCEKFDELLQVSNQS